MLPLLLPLQTFSRPDAPLTLSRRSKETSREIAHHTINSVICTKCTISSGWQRRHFSWRAVLGAEGGKLSGLRSMVLLHRKQKERKKEKNVSYRPGRVWRCWEGCSPNQPANIKYLLDTTVHTLHRNKNLTELFGPIEVSGASSPIGDRGRPAMSNVGRNDDHATELAFLLLVFMILFLAPDSKGQEGQEGESRSPGHHRTVWSAFSLCRQEEETPEHEGVTGVVTCCPFLLLFRAPSSPTASSYFKVPVNRSPKISRT